jgi:hypothetical protein
LKNGWEPISISTLNNTSGMKRNWCYLKDFNKAFRSENTPPAYTVHGKVFSPLNEITEWQIVSNPIAFLNDEFNEINL